MSDIVEKMEQAYQQELLTDEELPQLIAWAWGRLRRDWEDLVNSGDRDDLCQLDHRGVRDMLDLARNIKQTVNKIAFAYYMVVSQWQEQVEAAEAASAAARAAAEG
jgi:hypothetical protein